MSHPISADRFEWSDAFHLGYEPMDTVHEEFVQIVSALADCADTDLLTQMDLFLNHAQAHFWEEDDWMRKTDFPASDCHIAEHSAVLRSAREVRELVATGNVEVCRRFAAELMRWFPGHADHLDSALAHWMFQRTFGGKPVVIRRRMALCSVA